MEILRDVLALIGAGTVLCTLALVAWFVVAGDTESDLQTDPDDDDDSFRY